MSLTPEQEIRLQNLLAKAQRAKRMAALGKSMQNIADDQESYNPTNGMSAAAKFGAGLDSGIMQAVKGVGNLVGLVDDKTVQDQQELDRALGETGWGTAGQLTSQMAMTAPIGGGLGMGAKALSTASKLPRAVAATGRVLGSLPGRSAVEGAVNAAIFADPDQRGEEAWKGAAFGGGLGVLGKAGGRMVKGLAKEGADAENLRVLAAQHGRDTFIPVAQGVSDDADLLSRGVKSIYKDALPYVPGVTAQLKAQGRGLANDVRAIALEEADHSGIFKQRPDLLSKPEEAVAALKKNFDDLYDKSVKRYDYSLPDIKALSAQVEARVKQAIPMADDVTLNRVKGIVLENLSRFSNGFNKSKNVRDPNSGMIHTLRRLIDGDSMLAAKNTINREIGALKGREGAAAREAVKVVDDIIEQSMLMSGKPTYIMDLRRFREANDAWSKFLPVSRAVKSAVVDEGEFTGRQLARAATRDKVQRAIGTTAHRVQKQPLGIPSAAGRWAGRFGLAGLGLASFPAAVTGFAGANALATKSAQEFILGRTALQRKLIELLRKNPAALVAGSGIRGGLEAQLADQYQGEQ